MASANGYPQELLDPAVVSALGRLELIATRVVEGLLVGRHRSPFKGSSVEFAEHRAYSPGDELRLIDWRALARRDRYYVKQYEDRTNLRAVLVVDATGSMGFGLRTVTKLRYAQMAAACLARLLLRQTDAAGLSVVGPDGDGYIPPRSAPYHLHVLLDALEKLNARGDASLAERLHDLARRLRRRGMILVFSDCFGDVAPLVRSLHHLRVRGHEVLLFHTLAPEEITFDVGAWTQFEDLEAPGERIELDAGAVRKQYLARFEAFLDALREGCTEAKCAYMPLTTDQSLGETLAQCLARREARVSMRA